MIDKTLGIPFGKPSFPDREDYVMLVQEGYKSNVGKVSSIDLVKELSNAIYRTGGIHIDCGIGPDGNVVETALLAYPSRPSLEFTVGVTRGSLSEGVVQKDQVMERLQIKMSTTAQLSRPSSGVVSSQWFGDVYNKYGQILSNPSFEVEGRDIVVSETVYGILEIIHTVYSVRYELTIPPNESDVENVYQCVAYARWSGGVTMIDVQPPPNAEAAYFGDIPCEWITLLNVNPRAPAGLPPVGGQNDEIRIDYCTQMVKNG